MRALNKDLSDEKKRNRNSTNIAKKDGKNEYKDVLKVL